MLHLESVVEVEMHWDSGDPSVGINPGWAETFVDIVYAGLYRTCFGFEVVIDEPVMDWPVVEVQVNLLPAARVKDHMPSKFLGLAFEDQTPKAIPIWEDGHKTGERQLTLGDLPLVCEAVEHHWAGVISAEHANEWAES